MQPRNAWLIAALAVLAASALRTDARPGPAAWTQFRLNGANNAVLAGPLSASWKLRTPGAFSSSPTYAGGVLYIANNAGDVYAIDAASGRVVWTRRFHDPVMTALLIDGDLLFGGEGNANSGAGSSPVHPFWVGDGENALFALRRSDGAVQWRLPLSGTGMPTPALIGGLLLHHGGRGMLVAVDPVTGKLRYKRNLRAIPSMISMLPLPGADVVTAGLEPNAVFRINARTGKTRWESKLPASASGIGDCPPVFDGKRIYCNYVAPPPHKTIAVRSPARMHAYALDAATGKKLWDVELEGGILRPRNESAIPLLADGVLFMGNALAPFVHALDPATGHIRWKRTVGGPVLGGAVDVNGTIYFGDLTGNLWALDARTGRVQARRNMGTAFNVGSPIVVGKTLFIGSLGGDVLAIPLAAL